MNRIKKWWRESKTWQHVLLGIGLVVFLYLVAVFSVRVFSRGKILPGVSARGIYLGGLTRSQAEAKLAVFEWIEGWYNLHCSNSSPGRISPVNFERRYLPGKTA